MLRLWRGMLRLGLMPAQIYLLIMLLIPKVSATGDRPIGLFPTPARLLSRWLRGTYGEGWRKEHDRDYFFGAKARGATVCTWRVSAFAEYARATGKDAAVALYDLVKAFEFIRHRWLKEQAIKHGFNLLVLRFLLGLYSMPRRIRVGKIFNSLFRVFRTVVPGDSFADLMVRLTVIDVLDEVVEHHRGLQVACVVDDVQFLAVGDCAQVSSDIVRASRRLVESFDSIGLTVSTKPDKLSILTSSPALQSCIQRRLFLRTRKVKGCFKQGARNLGVDLSLRRRVAAVQKLRLKKAAERGRRLLRVRKAGVSASRIAMIAKAGLNTVAMYGVGVVGMSDSAIDQARRIVHGAVEKKPHGRSATADLEMLHDSLDPAYEATIAPIVMWVSGLWLGWMPKPFMARTMQAAIDTAATCTNLWHVAKGPATVVLASLMRIGWSQIEPFIWRTANGTTIDITDTSASDVARFARVDVRNWLWNRAATRRAAYADFSAAPFTAPLRTLMKTKDRPGWGPEHKGMLRCIIADAWWGEGPCALCGLPWSTWHGHWNCEATARYKLQYDLPSTILDCAARGKDVPLFSCCLLADPIQCFPPPVPDHDVVWKCHGDDVGTFGAEAFGDGSGYYNSHDATRRCGFAVVAVSRVGGSRFLGTSACGPLPGALQEVPLAELMALIFFLRHAVPDGNGRLWFYCDCAWVVDSFDKGEDYLTHPMRCFASAWRTLFKVLDDVVDVRSHLNLIKVKAHTSVVACGGDELLLFYKRGNDHADVEAKEGALRHPICQEDLDRLRRCCIVQPIVAKFLARQAVWRRESFGKAVLPERPPKRRVLAKSCQGPHDSIDSSPLSPDTGDHRCCSDPLSLRVRCIKCLASADTIATLRKTPCRPAGDQLRHKLWRLEGFVFCRVCGAHSEKRTIGLGDACHGAPKSSSAEYRRVRLLNGKHPLSGAALGVPVPLIQWDEWHGSVSGLLDAASVEDIGKLLEFPELSLTPS